METKFNFNSQVCTSRSQSERLLTLGLKKETADMVLTEFSDGIWRPTIIHDWVEETDDYDVSHYPQFQPIDIPAWSLHRLIEMTHKNTIDNNAVVLSRNQTYDQLIGRIARQIKEGKLNKEYLV